MTSCSSSLYMMLANILGCYNWLQEWQLSVSERVGAIEANQNEREKKTKALSGIQLTGQSELKLPRDCLLPQSSFKQLITSAFTYPWTIMNKSLLNRIEHI